MKFEPEKRENNGGVIGIDVGIKSYCCDNKGTTVDNPRYFEKSERRRIREQRRLARKKKGSKNRNKQRMRLAKAYERVANQQTDFLHKITTMLLRENQTICIERLKVERMVKKNYLAKYIKSASWSTFARMLEYKAIWYGNTVVQIPTAYPSSQLCSRCGYKYPRVKNLAIRTWECPVCHEYHDRDHNAAINILHKGLEMINNIVG